jgi:CheY-like chemotaxis protein
VLIPGIGEAGPGLKEGSNLTVCADGGRILIVERDHVVRELQEFFLKRAGFDVEFCDDGLAALENAIQSPPALVVTEILVPGLDGLSLCRQLGEHPATQSVPVVVFSILAAASRAAEAGAKAFLRKPMVESVFIDAVRGALPVHPIQKEDRWSPT